MKRIQIPNAHLFSLNDLLPRRSKGRGVKLLTSVMICSLLSSCSLITTNKPYCNSRAYIRPGLEDYISQRFPKDAPIRMAIIPFTAPANLSGFGLNLPSIGRELAWKVHAEVLRQHALPIVEIFPREDWPGKREEFFRGNFGAIAQAREAAYDLILIGLIDSISGVDQLSAYSKIIDVDSGVTVWYGHTNASVETLSLDHPLYALGLATPRPDQLKTNHLVDTLAECIAKEATDDEDMPFSELPDEETSLRARGPGPKYPE